MTRLMHVFWDVDMRGRHEALAEHAKKERKFNIEKLNPGDMMAFINRARDRIIVLAGVDEKDSYGVLGYYRSPHGRIDPHAIQYIPSAFSGGRLDMNEALRKSLTERLAKKGGRVVAVARTPSRGAQELRKQIRDGGLKQWWVAEQAGVHKTTLRRLLKGEISNKNSAAYARVASVVAEANNVATA